MKRPAIFFDRDNTLIAADGYLGDPAGVKLVRGAASAVARARRLGYATVVVSNQSGVARGMFDEAAVHAVNQRLEQLLLADDPAAVIDRHEFCPFHPDAEIEAYRQDSDLRKPRPGMILQAADMLALDLARSWVIGDAPRDVASGRAAGCRTILLTDPSLAPSPAAEEDITVEPDFRVASLTEAIEVIERNPDPAPSGNQVRAAQSKPKPAEADRSSRSRFAESSVVDQSAATQASIASALVGGAGVGPSKPRPSSSAVADEPPRVAPKPPLVIELPKPAPPSASDKPPATPAPMKIAPPPATTPTQSTPRIEALLDQILFELRRRDADVEEDFSVSKLLAGIVQVLAIGLVFVAYLNREDTERFYPLILFSLFVQMLVVALLIMGRQR